MPPMRKQTPRPVGRPEGKSGLPAPIAGEPFSLIGTLRRCDRMLTVNDIAEMLQVSKRVIYRQINEGKIPVADAGFDITRVDPKAWAFLLEKKNPHLKPSVRDYLAA